MKIALVPLNPTVGDVTGNLAQILTHIESAQNQGCELVIFPELALVGYPPRDLLHFDALHKKQSEALNVLRRKSKNIRIICGGIQRNTLAGKPNLNTAYFFQNGQRFEYHKQLLPEYDVFDERRYFEPGSKPFTFRIGKLKFGLTICEDIWHRQIRSGKEYPSDPLNSYERLGIDYMINLSASPFETGKSSLRRKVLSHAARATRCGLLYVNQFGANDELIYDGITAFAPRSGEIQYGPEFSGSLICFNTDSKKLDHQTDLLEDLEALKAALILGIRDYISKTGHKRVVLGLSGGIDSALVAYLAERALGPDAVLGILMPSRYSSKSSVTDAELLANNLKIKTQTVSIDPIHQAFEQTFAQLFANQTVQDLTAQNIQARIRGNLLMAVSNNSGRLLLNTTNKSEMAVGYGTLYGDLCGALSVLSDIPKTVVYELSEMINSKAGFDLIPHAIISKAPSAELKPDQCDQDTLPSYESLDAMIDAVVVHEQLTLNPENISHTVKRMLFNSEYKRRQAPPGLKVSIKAFGTGRRMPIAAKLDTGDSI